jgi:hypothetical protein
MVALFSICAGLVYGAWVDGLGSVPLAGALGTLLLALAVALAWLRRRQRAEPAA